MARFLRHEGCDKCGSRDNKAIYDDGSTYCFGCGNLYKGERTLADIRAVKKEDAGSLVVLPHDCSCDIPEKGLKWLYKYINKQEIEKYGICFSHHFDSVVLPCYHQSFPNRVVGYTARRFGGGTKYYEQGDKLQMSLSMLRSRSSETLFFVEDYLSAVKVSRHFPCIPLFGSTMPLGLILGHLESFKSFRLWLDPDKKQSAVRQCYNAKQLGIDIKPVFSDVDPKECTDEQVKDKG